MELIFEDNSYDVALAQSEAGYEATVNGGKTDFRLTQSAASTYLIKQDGKNLPAYCAEDENKLYVRINELTYVFDKPKEEEKSFDDAIANSADKQLVHPPMPGSIVKIQVKKGQSVKEGESLIIVEAMKMETALYASIDGVITEINVKEGEQVDSDCVMIVVEKEAAEE